MVKNSLELQVGLIYVCGDLLNANAQWIFLEVKVEKAIHKQ